MKQCNGKVIYASHHAAKKVLVTRERYGSSRLRIYECETCHGYHLTSTKYKRYG